jgi:hypothetical protein
MQNQEDGTSLVQSSVGFASTISLSCPFSTDDAKTVSLPAWWAFSLAADLHLNNIKKLIRCQYQNQVVVKQK